MYLYGNKVLKTKQKKTKNDIIVIRMLNCVTEIYNDVCKN